MLYLTDNIANAKGIKFGNTFLPFPATGPEPGQKGFCLESSGRKLFFPLNERDTPPPSGAKGFHVTLPGNHSLFIPVLSEEPVSVLSRLALHRCGKQGEGVHGGTVVGQFPVGQFQL